MSSQEGSVATSGDSEAYGGVARAGFTRMYVLLHSAQSPLDQHLDYRSEWVDEDDAKASGDDAKPRRRYEDLENEYDEEEGDGGVERLQLLYANGRHYFHGTIPLPDGLVDGQDDVEEEEKDAMERRRSRDQEEDQEDGSGSDESPRAKESRRRQRMRRRRRGDPAASIDIHDLPLLLPHFQERQDELTVIEDVLHFRQELRDVVYQMEEVGEFMVEELSKDKVIQRIDEGSKEFHWMVSPQNPTFFELQTYRRTNEAFEDAGVLLVVMKIVVRGVLLDVIYHKDSYFVTLRENAEELALEDMFIPNLSCVGPCFIVRRYSDPDLKQLLLWCAFPPSSAISVEGRSVSSSSPTADLSLHIPAKNEPTVLKVAPMRSSASVATILHANDTQLYCVLPRTSRQRAKKYQKATATRRPRREAAVEEDVEDEEQEVNVVFQFNQYLYNGKATVVPSEMNDLNKLSQQVLPELKQQALTSLSFFGSLGDDADPTELPTPILWTMHVKKRFESIAVTLLDLVTQSQVWVEKFLSEIDSVAKESAASADSVDWLGSHLRGWLDNSDGSEYFYELELTVVPQFLWGERDYEEAETLKSSDVDLMLWKGVVNQAVVVVVYRRGSFYVVLREVEDVSAMPRDGLEFFGLLPELAGKGRGYLIRNFPGQIKGSNPQWLSGAKLLLWQTVGSIAREDSAAEEAQAKWQQSQRKQDDDKATADWFEDKSEDKQPARDEDVVVRRAEHIDEHKQDAGVSSPSSTRQREKVSKPHHLAPMGGLHNAPRGAAPAPWDIRTGRPV